ncbi:MAG: DUF1573 domain-containing protein [Anditalea sp.]
MKKSFVPLFLFIPALFCSTFAKAQYFEERTLIWEKDLIDIGSVMEENGEVISEFFFVNKADFPIFIEEVITDCGCTTASYTTDTLSQDKIGSVKISYDPSGRGGTFSKMIIVKTNIDSDGDSLFLEGNSIPYRENIEDHYSRRIGNLGFNTTPINMGNVFTNEPEIKQVAFYNYNTYPIIMNEVRTLAPDYVQLKFVPTVVPAKSRGVLELSYDGAEKNDLGFFEEDIEITLIGNGEPVIPLKLMVTVHEYFAPVRKSEVDNIPKLALSEMEVDLNRIDEDTPISKIITLTNIGGEPLNIRKIVTNCDCLAFFLEKEDLAVDEEADLIFTFDPKGRRGIDHKTLTIFSNDPLNPTRTVIIKSSVR